jgi:beta-N-acetylhexosaminidase
VSTPSRELDRLAAACLFPGFAGVEAPVWLRSWLGAGLGGVVLFARNVADRDRLADLTRSLHAERRDVIVAMDEEGGDVTRLEADPGSSYPGNYALGAVDDVELTERVGRSMGSELAVVGVDLNLAPVADVNSNPANPIIGVRSFGADPDLVARHVRAFVTGVQAAGIGACAKHFPGHGDTDLDSHLELPVLAADRATLEARELPPFRAAVEAGVRGVMTAHIVAEAIDGEPATLSAAALRLLRDDLGFRGLVITDALEMAAVSRAASMEELAMRALRAGADALCLGADVDAGLVERVHAAIVAAVQSGRLAEERLAEAAGRVAETARLTSRAAGGGGLPDPEVGLEAARRALRAEGDVASDGTLLVVELRPAASIAAGGAGRGLGTAVRSRAPATAVVRLDAAPEDATAVLRGYEGRRLVVVVRDAHRHEWQRASADALLKAAGGGIVVETGLAVWRPDGATDYVVTYGAGRVNLEAAADLLAAP